MQPNTDTWAPDYIVIGAMKSASTWLNRCLIEHPEIVGGKNKELHFFDSDVDYAKGKEFYRSLFPDDIEGKIVGESTPSYLYEEAVPFRIHALFPDVKLIVCLRDPAERAWSHYQYALQQQARLSIYNSFADAFASDSSLAMNGRYAEQLERYQKYYPNAQIKVIFYEDIVDRPAEVIKGVFEYLGIKDCQFRPAAIDNQSNATGDRSVQLPNPTLWKFMLRIRQKVRQSDAVNNFLVSTGLLKAVKSGYRSRAKVTFNDKKQSKPKMSSSDRQVVIDTLGDDIVNLEAMLSRDLGTWKRA